MGLLDYFRRRKENSNFRKAYRRNPEQMSEEELRVQRDIHQAYKMLAHATGVSFDEDDLPPVRVSDDKTSYYTGLSGEIVISRKHIGSGVAYFEEASHALRDSVMRRKGLSFDKQDSQVHEFYGRIGETLGRYLSRGTSLEEYFSGEDEKSRDLNDRETRHKWAVKLNKIRNLKNEVRNYKSAVKKSRDYLLKVTKENYEQLEKLFRDFEKKRIGSEEFSERAAELARSYQRAIVGVSQQTGFNLRKSDLEEANAYYLKYDSLINIGRLKDVSEEDKREFILSRIKTLREVNPYERISMTTNLDDPVFSDAYLTSMMEEHSHFVHRKPYQYAQQYSAEELLKIKDLYGLPDREVRKRFFKRKPSDLERKVETLFFIILSVFLAWAFGTFSFTGYSVVPFYLQASVGSFLGILFFFFLIAWIYFKVERRLNR